MELINKDISNDIKLREFVITDIENKVNWINNPLNNKYLHYNIPLSIEDTRLWYNQKDNSKRLDLVIEYDGCAVGVIGLLNIDKVNKKAEYYITIGEQDVKNKGIATLATRILLYYAFEEYGLNKVYLYVDAENTLACRLYEKVGMKKVGYFIEDLYARGHLVDRIRYEIVVSEYRRMVNEQ